jgi:hypothetical protein
MKHNLSILQVHPLLRFPRRRVPAPLILNLNLLTHSHTHTILDGLLSGLLIVFNRVKFVCYFVVVEDVTAVVALLGQLRGVELAVELDGIAGGGLG